MKALLLKESEKLILELMDNPIPQKGEKLVTVEITGIGGSEYLGFKNPGIRNLPNVMGHGICGWTKEGTQVAINPLLGCNTCEYCFQNLVQLCTKWKLIGVQMDGGFAQQIAVPNTSLVEIPENISWEQSCFIEPFANSINAWEISKISPEDKVLVIGAGGIGLGLIACAKNENHPEIYILEKSKNRNKAAKEIGAKIDSYDDNYFDVVFDTVGSFETRKAAFKLMKRNGKSIFIGFATAQQEINFSELIRMQYHIIGSFVYSSEQFAKATKLVQFTKNEWVKNLDFEEVEEQLKAFLNDDFSVIKSALRPNLDFGLNGNYGTGN